jgi:hypothetical protein
VGAAGWQQVGRELLARRAPFGGFEAAASTEANLAAVLITVITSPVFMTLQLAICQLISIWCPGAGHHNLVISMTYYQSGTQIVTLNPIAYFSKGPTSLVPRNSSARTASSRRSASAGRV